MEHLKNVSLVAFFFLHDFASFFRFNMCKKNISFPSSILEERNQRIIRKTFLLFWFRQTDTTKKTHSFLYICIYYNLKM